MRFLLLPFLVFLSSSSSADDTNTIYRTVITTNMVQQPSNWRRFGDQVVDLRRPNSLVKLHGLPTSELNSNVTFDVYTEKVIPGIVNSLQSVGAYSGGGLATRWEYDRTVAVTNFPSLKNHQVSKQIDIQAKLVGSTKVENTIVDYYDFGTPWVMILIRTNKVPVKE